MEKRLFFNEDAARYDRWRPRYCKDLFAAIIGHAGLGPGSLAVEVGCGTGQATGPMLETGCRVLAVEVGDNMAAFVAEKFQDQPGFTVVNEAFEAFACRQDSVDLLYSATAFHWVPQEIGYAKAFAMLKPGGTIALFWNRPFAGRQDNPVHQAVQAVYREMLGSEDVEEYALERFRKVPRLLTENGFMDVSFHLYQGMRTFSAAEYCALLGTYSSNWEMPASRKADFLAGVAEAIGAHGGVMPVFDTMDLHLARKPT